MVSMADPVTGLQTMVVTPVAEVEVMARLEDLQVRVADVRVRPRLLQALVELVLLEGALHRLRGLGRGNLNKDH